MRRATRVRGGRDSALVMAACLAAQRPAQISRIDGIGGRRRLLCQLAAGLLAAASTPGLAQARQARRARVGWLALSALPNAGFRALSIEFLALMRERGWREGTNLIFEARGPTTDKTLVAAAAELVAWKPDVLVSAGTPAVKILSDLTAEIPIVMSGAGDPVGTGLIASLARPGGNITGVSWQLRELIPKALSVLHEFVPQASRIDFLNQTNDPGQAFFAAIMVDAAKARGLDSHAVQVGNVDDLVAAISASTADAMLMLATGMIYASAQRIAAAAIQRRLPLAVTGGPGRAPAVAGLLFCYTANHEEALRRTADCVDRILRGAKPANLPVEQPRRHDFVVNLKTARAIGLAVPKALLLRADEVIE